MQMKKLRFCFWLSVLILITGCSGGEKPPVNAVQLGTTPPITPDYIDLTIPHNIAPLNFSLKDEVDKCYAQLKDADGQILEAFGKQQIRWDLKQWQIMLAANAGKTLQVKVATCKENTWQVYKTYTLQISADSIDAGLVYRLIEPGYEKWHIVGIYQRNLQNFDEKPILRNDMIGYGCMNCHSFCMGDPSQLMFHVRVANGGTFIAQEGKIKKIATKTKATIGKMAYPYWHPSGHFIVASVNKIENFFHAVKGKKMEVFDSASDVVVYDIRKNTILSKASFITDKAYETFPSFSPDGKWLYFCSAPALPMPEEYDKIRYNLCRVAFDATKGEIQMPIDTLARADSMSYVFPRVSPNGHFILYTQTAYGQFPIWHKDADACMLDLRSGKAIDLSVLNSDDTDSYHSWSQNSKWIVLSSRRKNGLYTLTYFSHIASDGTPSKPFVMPQEDPELYDYLMYSYNLPELVKGEVTINPYDLEHEAKTQLPKPVLWDGK